MSSFFAIQIYTTYCTLSYADLRAFYIAFDNSRFNRNDSVYQVVVELKNNRSLVCDCKIHKIKPLAVCKCS